MDPQKTREDIAAGEWTVECEECDTTTVVVCRHEPNQCPACGSVFGHEVTPGRID